MKCIDRSQEGYISILTGQSRPIVQERLTDASLAAIACLGFLLATKACLRDCQMQVARFSPASLGDPYLK